MSRINPSEHDPRPSPTLDLAEAVRAAKGPSPDREEVEAVAKAIFDAEAEGCDGYFEELCVHMARAAIRALDAYRTRRFPNAITSDADDKMREQPRFDDKFPHPV